MSRQQHQHCPICRIELPPSPRYPRYVCAPCAARATDEHGRLLSFFNESFSGGFIATYSDTGEVRNSHICVIDGLQCWADEARFGGIVIQLMDP